MRRGRILILIGLAAFLFLGFSALLARALTGAGDERAQVLDAAPGPGAPATPAGVLAELPGLPRASRPAPRSRATRVAELRAPRPGRDPQLHAVGAGGAHPPHRGRPRGLARGQSQPVVQCVRVRRDGPLTGGDVELLSISAPIGNEEGCAESRAMRPVVLGVLLLALAAPAAAQAADTPTARTLYEDGPEGRYLMEGDWLFRLDAADRGSAAATTARRARPAGARSRSRTPGTSATTRWRSMNGSVGWYRKDFELPDTSAALDWAVRFESVNYRARVWLNGREVGSHAGAYLPFTVPLQRPPARVNRLVVRVDSRRTATDLPPGARSARARGCPPAAGGTTAASCARSTSRRSTRWPSSRRS